MLLRARSGQPRARRQAGAARAQRAAAGRRHLPRRARRARASRPCCGCSTGSPTPSRGRSATAARTCASATRSRCGARSCLVPQLPALLEGTVADNIRFAAELAGPRARRRPAARPRRARSELRRARRVAALGRRAAARDARPGAGARAAGAAARRADLGARRGARPARSRRRCSSCASGSRSRSCSSPTTSRRRGGCRIGWSGSRPGARSSRGRPRSCSASGELMGAVGIDVSLGEVAASLVLVALAIAVSFWRRTELEGEIAVAVVRSVGPADRDRLRDPGDLRRGQPRAGVRADRGDGRLRRLHRPAAGAAGAGRVLAAAGRARRSPARRPSGSWSRSGSSSPSRATWCRSAGWWSATR